MVIRYIYPSNTHLSVVSLTKTGTGRRERVINLKFENTLSHILSVPFLMAFGSKAEGYHSSPPSATILSGASFLQGSEVVSRLVHTQEITGANPVPAIAPDRSPIRDAKISSKKLEKVGGAVSSVRGCSRMVTWGLDVESPSRFYVTVLPGLGPKVTPGKSPGSQQRA